MTGALIVPDQASWTMWGRDPGGLGFVPAATPEHARCLLLPDPVPTALVGAVREAWQRMPAPRRYLSWPRELPGTPVAEVLAEGAHDGGNGHHAHTDEHGDHDHHGDHGDRGDHGDMMAIVGDPSADGLVMESIELALGPLAAGLPGGLVLDLSLDGDVVERCEPRATLTMPLGEMAGGGGDPGASAAWTTVIALARERAAGTPADAETMRARIAAVETERALSHLTWMRGFGLVLGWSELGERAHEAAASLMPVRIEAERAGLTRLGAGEREELRAALEGPRRAVERLRRLLDGSRRLRSRTRGRAQLSTRRLAQTDAGGPVARAAGLARDARGGDPLYEALGFRETTRPEGDTEARTLLRASEAAAALDLAGAALAGHGGEEAIAAGRPDDAVVEGPRGPVRASLRAGGLELSTPGTAALLALAGEAVTGLELGAALASVASFDLSGWSVSR